MVRKKEIKQKKYVQEQERKGETSFNRANINVSPSCMHGDELKRGVRRKQADVGK